LKGSVNLFIHDSQGSQPLNPQSKPGLQDTLMALALKVSPIDYKSVSFE